MDEIKDRASTSDVYLAAAYLSLVAIYAGTDKTNPRQMIFKFNLPDTLPPNSIVGIFSFFENIEKKWINGDLLVHAKKYKEALQSLKSVIHSGD